MTRDPRIDAYIEHAAPFARPILAHVRALVHKACPQVEETIKWGMPTFVHAGGILCGMAAFKAHCAFHFWKGSLIVDLKHGTADEAMGQFGRVTRIADLPSKSVLKGYVKKAVQLNEAGVKPARPKRAPRPPAAVPDDLAAALRRNQAARKTFEGFSPSQQREYVEWITEARREETRKSRLATTLEWLAEGKQRNWKYQ